jgi:phosphopantetheinyl transferase
MFAVLDGQSLQSETAPPPAVDNFRIERRSSLRPRFSESWEKTLKPDCRCPGAENELSVEIWVARVSSFLSASSSFKVLTDEDWKGLHLLRSRPARDSAMAGRILLRFALSHLAKQRVAPREWRFERTALAKPHVSGAMAHIKFSISHADAVVVVAVSSRLEVGVDVESVDQCLTADVIAGFCNAEEQKVLQKVPQHLKAREFVRFWTMKEAYTKLLGSGHSIDFSSIECLSRTIDSSACGSQPSILFESFYVPVGHSLYHATLAVENVNEPVVIRIVEVAGADETNDAPTSPAGD